MPSRFLPKQIFITRLLLYLNNCTTISGGFIQDIIQIVRKYDMVSYVDNCTTISGGFIPDIIKIVRKYDLFSYVDNFVKTSLFPSSKSGNI